MKIFKFTLSLLLIAAMSNLNLKAQKANPDLIAEDSFELSSFNDPILEMLDSLAASLYFRSYDFTTDTAILNIYNFPPDSVPDYPAEVYAERIEKLNATSPFPYEYNPTVKKYIDYFAFRKRNYMSRMLGLAELYFPLFEEKLDQYNIPLEIKYLAIVESALNPFAVSRAKATGLWQFMYRTGLMYNLKIDSYIDERYDPYKSTVAACEYMNDMYRLYGDWAMVLASYNAGPGNVNKAIRRSGGKTNFWEVMSFLPKETQGYVPAFIAISYVMNYAAEHNIYPLAPRITYYNLDTLMVHQAITFEQISAVLNINEEDLRFLNPSYKKNTIPYYGDPMTLVLPAEYIGQFINYQDSIVNWAPLDANDNMLAKTNAVEAVSENKSLNTKKFHNVRSGEHLSGIARKYNVEVNDLRQWNNLKTNTLKIGQRLIVYVPTQETQVSGDIGTANANSPNKEEKKTIIHTIQSGDTLWSIANRYSVSIDMIMKWNNISNARGLKPGDRIKIEVG